LTAIPNQHAVSPTLACPSSRGPLDLANFIASQTVTLGASRHFTAKQHFGRFWSGADIEPGLWVHTPAVLKVGGSGREASDGGEVAGVDEPPATLPASGADVAGLAPPSRDLVADAGERGRWL